jgi:hypothetical protein
MEIIDIPSSPETVVTRRTRSKAAPPPQPQPLLPEWKRLEEQLRCDICKQLLDVPVSLKCYHTFCSLCIRRYLEMSGNDFCPCCRIPASSTDIRLEPRLAGVLKILGKERGKVRKQIRYYIQNVDSTFQPPNTCKNETFNKQADLCESFRHIKGDTVGRTLLPLYKSLKDKQLVELVGHKDGIEIPPNSNRDEIIKLHKEFLFTVQAVHDAVRMGLYAEHEPSRQALASVFNAETRLRLKREANKKIGFKRKQHLMTVQEKRREGIEKSESIIALTKQAGERMAEQLRIAIAKRRPN